MIKYFCPICGFKGLENTPEGLTKCFLGSHEICPCCGVQFGYHISPGVSGGVKNRIRELRQKWIDKGAQFHFEEDKPKDWNLEKQLANIGVILDKKTNKLKE